MVDRFNNPGVNNPGAPPAHGSHTDLDGGRHGGWPGGRYWDRTSDLLGV